MIHNKLLPLKFINDITKDRGGRGAGGDFSHWAVKKVFYFILLNHIHHLQNGYLPYILLSIIKVFSDKPDNFRQFVVSFAAERQTRFQPEFQLLFLFSFVLGSVFHESSRR